MNFSVRKVYSAVKYGMRIYVDPNLADYNYNKGVPMLYSYNISAHDLMIRYCEVVR